jgi:hypothetical protein
MVVKRKILSSCRESNPRTLILFGILSRGLTVMIEVSFNPSRQISGYHLQVVSGCLLPYPSLFTILDLLPSDSTLQLKQYH